MEQGVAPMPTLLVDAVPVFFLLMALEAAVVPIPSLAIALPTGGGILPGKLTMGKICPKFRDSIFTRVLSLRTEFFPLFCVEGKFNFS